jgi:uncharacterized protein YjbI with pentapeptide repeats
MARDALIVGINRYQYQALPDLTSPALDAEAIAVLLEQYGDFRVTRLPEAIEKSKPYVAQGLELRLAQLKKALVQLFKPEGRSVPDTALFYFSGHGLRDTQGIQEGFLASSDCNPDAEFYGLSLRWLRELLEASPIKQQIVLLDCCHSGELFNFNEANPGDRGSARDRCFIAASREFEAAQVSLDSEYSVLTQALLQGLDPQRQANITNFGLVDYLDQHLGNSTQRPIYSNFGEPIILTRAIISPTPPHLPTPPNPSHSDQCPYKGLRYFDIADADYFFGREDLINQLIDRVRQDNFLAILGASGSGKSSVLRAGLIYELMQGQRLSGSRHWSLKIIVPTAHPLQSLAKLFVDANLSVVDEAIETDKAIEFLQKGGESFNRLIAGYLDKNSQSKFLLIIDQFEETFTLCEDLQERNQFLACLLEVLANTEDKFKLILGMRIDFLGKCFEQDYHGLGKLIEANLITVSPLNTEQLQRAITEPAKKANLELEAGLVEQMLKDGDNQPGSLPLVQDTLTELWQKRVDNSLKLSVYVKLGGISGTLNKRATAFYNGLSASEKETVKVIFLALTQLGEGTEDTRRRVLKQDLITVKYPEEVIDAMIQRLANERLIVTDEQGETTNKKVAIEVAHEALIREWELLRQWLDQNRANLLQQRKIEALAQDWENSGRKSAYLLVGFRLKEARKFQKEQVLQYPLKKLGSDFIAKSVGKQRQNWLKLGVIPFVGVSVITFLGIRTYIVQSSWKIVQETQGEKYDVRRINALEDLVWWQESLANTSLEKANISQIQLPKADLQGANLESANLTSANLENANLESSNLTVANLTVANLSSVHLTSAILIGANLKSADLKNADLIGANLKNADLIGANLKNADLMGANLTGAKLIGANLTGANLTSANLTSTNLDGANLTNANLERANLKYANLNSTNLDSANLTGANLTSANLTSANFDSTHLEMADLTRANLTRANLTNAHLINVNLTNANLIKAKMLTYTQIKSACFWNEAIYKGHFDDQKQEWITDEKANQAFIVKLQQDKSSDTDSPNKSYFCRF